VLSPHTTIQTAQFLNFSAILSTISKTKKKMLLRNLWLIPK
jgi:hypothetical protein